MSDWYPRARDGQLHLVHAWLDVFAVKAAQWNIPQSRVTQLQADYTTASTILEVVKSGARTEESVVQCNIAFHEMNTEARFIKRHYLLLPPLTLSDLPTLLLRLPDDIPTVTGVPTGQVGLSTSYPGGPHQIIVHLGHLAGAGLADPRSEYGYSLYAGVMPPGGASLEQAASPKHYLMSAPLSGDELMYLRFTRRKKELVAFDAAEAGMTVYFCARYENQKGQHGAWGPVVSAIIT
jgi:hypothetical protein